MGLKNCIPKINHLNISERRFFLQTQSKVCEKCELRKNPVDDLFWSEMTLQLPLFPRHYDQSGRLIQLPLFPRHYDQSGRLILRCVSQVAGLYLQETERRLDRGQTKDPIPARVTFPNRATASGHPTSLSTVLSDGIGTPNVAFNGVGFIRIPFYKSDAITEHDDGLESTNQNPPSKYVPLALFPNTKGDDRQQSNSSGCSHPYSPSSQYYLLRRHKETRGLKEGRGSARNGILLNYICRLEKIFQIAVRLKRFGADFDCYVLYAPSPLPIDGRKEYAKNPGMKMDENEMEGDIFVLLLYWYHSVKLR
ncbi:hypothetical protein QE152_g8786 [Popillia japonica]|uniref:Uncharacterized protein n=1 Tax=Popillia japonica TaxID=7064 RepID=A0AAW1LWQ7_POPJA